tara:strand:- start:3433 stop:4524 length:1092 start_codon:yes stop_codon:yes gene_type:complete
MSDERKGCPSASGFERLLDCPGSFTLNKEAPEQPSSRAAARGTRVHAGCAGEVDILTLSRDEQQTVTELLQQEEILLDEFTNQQIGGGYSVEEQLTEKRFWGKATESEWSGKADRVYLLQKGTAKIALVVDFKSTRYTTEAEKSLQLAALAALVDEHYKRELSGVHVALVFPDGCDRAYYDDEALELAADECQQLVDRATITATQKRNPSASACKWCGAKAICPEARGQLAGLVKQQATSVAPADLPRLLKVSLVAKLLIKDIEEQAKTILSNGGTVEGWELKQGHTRSKITDTEEVYRRAAILGIDGETFSKQVTISKKDLDKLVREELQYKGKQAAETVATLLEGCTKDTVTAASLKEIKP